MSISLEEYDAKVLKRSSWKNKCIRVLMIDNKPKLQIRDKNNNKLTEHDISEVPGVFISFKSTKDEIVLKLITKKETITIKLPDEKDLENFRKQIDNNLNECHQRKNSLCTVRINNGRQRCLNMSSGFVSMSNPISTDSAYDQLPSMIETDQYTTMIKPDENIDLFDINYPETKFNSMIDPFKPDHKILERPSVEHDEIKLNTSICWKLRKETTHEGGVKLEIDKIHINDFSIKVIDKEIWISRISNYEINKNLHIGDRIMLVNGNVVTDKFGYQQQIKNYETNTLIIQRLPKAKVFLIDPCTFNYDNITFKKMRHYYQMNLNGKKDKWLITEVNSEIIINRPRNSIDFKNQIKSLVVQPREFIKSLTAPIT